MAYFRVHSLAVSPYFCLSVLYIRAISGTRGSSGFGSVSKEHIDKRTAMKTEHAWVMIGNNCMCHGQNWWIGKLLPQQKGNSNKLVLKSFLKVFQPFHEPFESNKHLKIVTQQSYKWNIYKLISQGKKEGTCLISVTAICTTSPALELRVPLIIAVLLKHILES